MDVYIIGVGLMPPRRSSQDLNFKEMIYGAAKRAYFDAGIEPKDVDVFVSISEDYEEGTAIFDEYVPDQLGAVLKPVHTITEDGITALFSLYALIKTGKFRIGVLEGHSKLSNILYPSHIHALALDPIYVRPFKLDPYFVAGLEMDLFLNRFGFDEFDAAMVVAKNNHYAMMFGRSGTAGPITPYDVLDSEIISEPLKELDIAPSADAACVIVVANEDVARSTDKYAVKIEGIGYAQGTPNVEEWEGEAEYLKVAADMAYSMAGIDNPVREIDFAEIDDTFSYKELQHIEALSICREGESADLLQDGFFDLDGDFPVNPTGGNIGNGNLSLMNSLRAIHDIVLQMRYSAGGVQLENTERALCASWKGFPSSQGGVVVLKRTKLRG